jgi:hypothetical protein
MPSPASSPWIMRYPQPGFSRASRRTSARMLRRVAGRPVLPRLDLAAWRWTMSRCQCTIVSGVISSRSPWRRAFGMTPSRVASRARSAQCNFSRRGCRRCGTLIWWRRIKISAVFHISSRRDSRNPAATRVIRRNTNLKHMISDHHGRTAGRATLLVRAVDEIPGPHNARAAIRASRLREDPGAESQRHAPPERFECGAPFVRRLPSTMRETRG